MRPDANVVVMVQGETNDGRILDETYSGKFCIVYMADEDGVTANAFGASNALIAKGVIHSQDELAEKLRADFPQIELIEKLEAFSELGGLGALIGTLVGDDDDEEDDLDE